jgi:trans-aconitate 2-methyltransferase
MWDPGLYQRYAGERGQAFSDLVARVRAGEYGERARAAYPARPYGTVLPFRRVFAVARKP